MKDDLASFKKVNDLIVNSQKDFGWRMPVDSFKLYFPESSSIVNELMTEYKLSEIQVHAIGDSQMGIAYKLGYSKKKPFRYLLYSTDYTKKQSFESYEQFTECGVKKVIDDKWTIVTITDCTD